MNAKYEMTDDVYQSALRGADEGRRSKR